MPPPLVGEALAWDSFFDLIAGAPRPTSAARPNITPALPKGAKRQTPKTRRPAKGSPTRGAVTAKPVTERFNPRCRALRDWEGSENFFQKISKKSERNLRFMYYREWNCEDTTQNCVIYQCGGRADKSDCSTPRNDITAVHNMLYIAEYFVWEGEGKIKFHYWKYWIYML